MSAILPFKISTLVYVQNKAGEILLIKRNKSPNLGMWSPIGGKLEMERGESPFESARRETNEEIGLILEDKDLHLFSMISEKNYENKMHWLMFMFHCKKQIGALPPEIDEGRFAFFHPDKIMDLPIPETDRQSLWPQYFEHKNDFIAQRADCKAGHPIDFTIEQLIKSNPTMC